MELLPMSKSIRLDKYLAVCGLGTRSEIKKLLKQNIITVDGAVERDPARQVDPAATQVACNDELLQYSQFVYIMLNKPEGVLSSTGDRWHDTVIDLLEGAYPGHDLFPAGRLDLDTTGFVLLTDDGALAHDLLSPKKHVAKVYEAQLDLPVTQAAIDSFATGIDLSDFVSKPAQLKALDGNKGEVALTEGKFHQVKRMFEACGLQVLELHRKAIGPLTLDEDLEPGQWRDLTEEEIAALKNHRES